MESTNLLKELRLASCIHNYKHRKDALYHLNLAYGQMLVEQKLLKPEEFKQIAAGLKKVREEVVEDDFNGTDGDIHYMCEKHLVEHIDPKIACKLHIGRSRNDMYFAIYRLSVRDAITSVIDQVLETLSVLEQKAKENIDVVIPYYTYGQPSQPGTWGHYLMTVHGLFEMDLKRLKAAYETVNQSPMGAAAGIGTAFHINRARVAELLGFDGIIDNTFIGNSDVGYFLETVSSLAILNTTLSRVASDMEFFATAECRLLDCEDFLCGGSSIMPQKKNAIGVEVLRSLTENWNGYVVNCFSSASSSTLFPVQETYYYFQKFWENVQVLINNLKLFDLILNHSKINKDRGYRLALDGFTSATGMAEELTLELNEPFEVTHQVVGGMVKRLMKDNRLDVKNMTASLLKDVSKDVLGYPVEKTDEQVQAYMDPLSSLNAKSTGGTPKVADTEALMQKALEDKKVFEAWFNAAKDQVRLANEKVEALADTL